VQLSYSVLASLPHPSDTFTQGLIVDGDEIVESSGLYGRSFLTRYAASAEDPGARHRLPDDFFAEGIAQVGSKLWLLSWRRGLALLLDASTFQVEGEAAYRGEGWGLAYDGRSLIMSNGSDQLSFRDPQTFALQRALPVMRGGAAVYRLNELEYAHGWIWANVWYSTTIVIIDPSTGRVRGELDLAQLAAPHQARHAESVLNGIAYDPQADAYWVTGKYWSHRYLIEVDISGI